MPKNSNKSKGGSHSQVGPLNQSPSSVTMQAHIGPLPHPDDLVRYNQAGSNVVETILRMAEREQQIREENNRTQLDIKSREVAMNERANEIIYRQTELEYKDRRHKRICIILLVVLILASTLWLYVKSKNGALLIAFFVEVAAFTGFMFWGKNYKKKSEEEASQMDLPGIDES